MATHEPLIHTNPQASIKIGQLKNVITQTSNYQCLAGESGSHYLNTGAGNVVVFTLPALLSGWEGWFHAAVIAQDLVISSPDVDTMIVFNDIAADQIALNTANEIAGGTFHVTCDGTLWLVSELVHRDNTVPQTAQIAT